MPGPSDFIPPPSKSLAGGIPLFGFVEAEIKGDYTKLNDQAFVEFMEARFDGKKLNIFDRLIGLSDPLTIDAERFYKACIYLFQGKLGLAKGELHHIVYRDELFKREADLCRAVCKRYSDLKDEEFYAEACKRYKDNAPQSALEYVLAIRIPSVFDGRPLSIDRIIERHDRVLMHSAAAYFRAGINAQGYSLLGRTHRPVNSYPDAGILAKLAPRRWEGFPRP